MLLVPHSPVHPTPARPLLRSRDGNIQKKGTCVVRMCRILLYEALFFLLRFFSCVFSCVFSRFSCSSFFLGFSILFSSFLFFLLFLGLLKFSPIFLRFGALIASHGSRFPHERECGGRVHFLHRTRHGYRADWVRGGGDIGIEGVKVKERDFKLERGYD